MFKGNAEYDTIAEIKNAIDIPVVANGDISDETQAKHVLDYTSADALMIGRAAQGNPWIFKQVNYFFGNWTKIEKTKFRRTRVSTNSTHKWCARTLR